MEGQLFHNGASFLLLRGYLVCSALRQQLGKAADQLLALLGDRLHVYLRVVHPAAGVALRLGWINAENGAEAGLLGMRAGHGHNGAVLPAGLVIAVHRRREKHLVQNGEAPCVAGAHAENHKVLLLRAGIDDLDFLALHLEIHQILRLGEEEILGAAHGV